MIKEFEKQDFTELIGKDTPVLVQYYADWCGPCQMLKPVIEQISKEMQDVEFVRVDIDQHRDLAVNEGVQSIPTVIMYKNGKEVARDAGFKPKNLLETWLNNNK